MPHSTTMPRDSSLSQRSTLSSRSRLRTGRTTLAICAALVFISAATGATIGTFEITLSEFFKTVWGRLTGNPPEDVSALKIGVLETIRFPRVILGIFVGASLGVAGAAMQGFFRNPLADPALIGVSSGAAVAAIAVIVLGGTALAPLISFFGPYAMPGVAFVGAFASVAFIYVISLSNGRVVVATMLLAGVAINALAFSGIGYLTFLANDDQLRDLTFWTLGSLADNRWDRIIAAIIFMGISIVGLLTLARPLNALLFGEADARNLGVNVERLKFTAAFLTALGVGAATAVCGVIGFVGLVVPHLVRLITGPDHRYVLPGSALLGAALVLMSDLIARIADDSLAELPLGVVTSAIGAPFFFWLLVRDKKTGHYG